MNMRFLNFTLFMFLAVSTVKAQPLKDDLLEFASELDSLKYSSEVFDQHEDFIILRFDCFIRRTHISGLVFDESSVRVLLSSGDQIVITPRSKLVNPVIVHEALQWILISGKHKYKLATPEQQTKARDFVKRASEESDDPLLSRLDLAQSFWARINSWSSIAWECKFELNRPKTNKSE